MRKRQRLCEVLHVRDRQAVRHDFCRMPVSVQSGDHRHLRVGAWSSGATSGALNEVASRAAGVGDAQPIQERVELGLGVDGRRHATPPLGARPVRPADHLVVILSARLRRSGPIAFPIDPSGAR